MASLNRSTLAGLGAALAVVLVTLWLMKVGPPGGDASAPATSDAAVPPPPGSATGLPVPKMPAPDQLPAYADVDLRWTVYDLSGEPLALADLRGRVVVLNFWATWCAPCLVEMPALEQLTAALDPEEAAVVLVSAEEPDVILDFLVEQGGDLPVYFADTNPPRALDVPYLPATFILDPEGAIVFRHVGAADWNHPSVRRFIRSLSRGVS